MTGGRPRQDAEVAAPEVRTRIAAAALDLFEHRGYDQTTVEAIAEAAGVARRTFFRYFRSKDDVILPDHDRITQAVVAQLEAAVDRPPVAALCSGARTVFRSYVDEPQTSLQRYRVIRGVPALRDREIAGVSDYSRLFSRYVRGRLEGRADTGPDVDTALRADIVAAAVVAAHNQVLREWLRAGGGYDPLPALDAAFAWVGATLEAGLSAAAADGAAQGGDELVIAVIRTRETAQDVVRRLRDLL